MKTIYFNQTATPISDFDIEKSFLSLKDNNEIYINNTLLIDRFRLGFLNKEIEQFKVILTDIDGNTIEEEINVHGELYDIVHSKIFNNESKIFSEQFDLKKTYKEKLHKLGKMIMLLPSKSTPISDYEIEDFFEKHKNDSIIFISNARLFERFVLGVYREEIVPFSATFEFEGNINVEYFFNLEKVFNSELLFNRIKIIASIWKILGTRNL